MGVITFGPRVFVYLKGLFWLQVVKVRKMSCWVLAAGGGGGAVVTLKLTIKLANIT